MSLVQTPFISTLSAGISPPSPTVHEVFSHILQLLHGQHLLEAHAELMMVEQLRDDILSQLHLRGLSSAQATVLSYFSGLQELNESLAKQLWDIVGSSLRLVREDPVLFVTAVRIIEREEKIDDTLLLEATFLPPGRPKGWRQKFYQVLQDTITGAHFHAPRMDAEGPGLARHLAALQKDIVSELCVVKDLMVQCVPAHYNILSVCTATYHQALTSHLQEILREDLDKQGIFLILEWALRVYHRSAPAPAPTKQGMLWRAGLFTSSWMGWESVSGCQGMTTRRAEGQVGTPGEQAFSALPHLCPPAQR